MKCNKCKFERCESNESYTDYYCEIFGDDVQEEFATDEGCNLRYNEAKKFCELNDKCIEKYYEAMNLCHSLHNGEPTKEKKAEIHKVNKEYSLALKKLKDYQDVLLSRRKRGGFYEC